MEHNNEQWKLLVYLLDEIRKDKGITHKEVAASTGLIESNVSRFFSAKYRPQLDIFLDIARAIKVNFFFQDTEDKSDLNQVFEKAMERLGRRPDSLPKN